MKLGRGAAPEQIVWIGSRCREGQVHHPSRVHDVEGATDVDLGDAVWVGNFNPTIRPLHNGHRSFPFVVCILQVISRLQRTSRSQMSLRCSQEPCLSASLQSSIDAASCSLL